MASSETLGQEKENEQQDRRLWWWRALFVALQLSVLTAAAITPRSSGTTIVSLMMVVFAIPMLINALLQGLVERALLRALAVVGVLFLLVIVVLGQGAATLAPPEHWYEWLYLCAPLLLALLLICVPAPAAGTPLFPKAGTQRKRVLWKALQIVFLLCVLIAAAYVFWKLGLSPLLAQCE